MKNIYLIIVMILIYMLNSCSNDDITIDREERGNTLRLSFSTKTAYEDFELSEDFMGLLSGGKGNYAIGLYYFIYDSKGILAMADSVYTKTFEQVNKNFGYLKTGTYTVIALEMLVDIDKNYRSDEWVIVGKDKLEDIQIIGKDQCQFWYSALGYKCERVEVTKEGYDQYNITPRGLGSIIETHYANFNPESGIVNVSLYTKQSPIGRKLSPEYSGDDRFVYEQFLEGNTWYERDFWFDNEGLNNDYLTAAYIIEEGDLEYCFGTQTLNQYNNNKFTPSCENTINVKEGKTYWGGLTYLGKDSSGSNFYEGTICSSFNTYKDWLDNIYNVYLYLPTPCLRWGVNAEFVRDYMTGEGMEFLTSYISTTQNFIIDYSNKLKTVTYQYQFDTDQTNLKNIFMVFNTDAFILDDVDSELAKQGFRYLTNDEGMLVYYTNTDWAFVTVGEFNNKEIWQVRYVKRSTSSSALPRKIIDDAINIVISDEVNAEGRDKQKKKIDIDDNIVIRKLFKDTRKNKIQKLK